MKKQQFGEKTFEIMENEFDVNDGRFMVFKQYFKQLQTKEDHPNFFVTFEKWKALKNKGNIIEADICWFDFAKMISIPDDFDAWEMCFALMSLGEEEDQSKTDENYLKEKIQYLRTCPEFTRGLVRSEVENFIMASKELSLIYILTMKVMEMVREQES